MILYRNRNYKKDDGQILIGKAILDYCARNQIMLDDIKGEGLQDRIRIAKGPHGKPFCIFPKGVHFSVSHSGSEWICCIQQAPIGADIEARSRQGIISLGQSRRGEEKARYTAIAERYFSYEEQLFAAAWGLEGFLEVWVRKEAYVKFKGTGLAEGFGNFSVVSGEQLDDHIDGVNLKTISNDQGFIGACCSSIAMEIETIVELEIGK